MYATPVFVRIIACATLMLVLAVAPSVYATRNNRLGPSTERYAFLYTLGMIAYGIFVGYLFHTGMVDILRGN